MVVAVRAVVIVSHVWGFGGGGRLVMASVRW